MDIRFFESVNDDDMIEIPVDSGNTVIRLVTDADKIAFKGRWDAYKAKVDMAVETSLAEPTQFELTEPEEDEGIPE